MKGPFMTPILSQHEKYTTTYNIVHGYSYTCSNMHINTTYVLSKLPLMHLVTEGELTLWWRFDDELWTRFVYVVLSVFCLSWVIPINNDPVRKHDGSCSETSHAKHVPVRKPMF